MSVRKSYARRLVEQDEKREAKAKTLGKKRCENCPKFFDKKTKWQRFCSKECKDQYHNYGSAYGKLRDTLTKLITREVASQVRDVVRLLVREEIEALRSASESPRGSDRAPRL